MNYFIEAFKKYAVFSGRARRSEYWYFALFNILVSVALWIVGAVITAMDRGESNFGMIPFDLYSLGAFLPALGVGVRRLHDVGKSGWWTLLGFVPVANFYLIVLLCQDSEPGENEFGPNPKAALALA